MNVGAVTCDSDTGDIHRFQRRPALNFGNVSVRLSSFRRRPESMDRLHRLRAWTPASTGVTVRVLHTLAVETDTLPGLPKEWVAPEAVFADGTPHLGRSRRRFREPCESNKAEP